MAKEQTPILFIDTNIFLDFYRSQGEAGLALLQRVESVLPHLILTDQVEMEFLSNRQRVISTALQSLKDSLQHPSIPAYLSDSKAAARIKRNIDDAKSQITSVRKRLALVLENPSTNDAVFRCVAKVFSSRETMNLKFSESALYGIIERASQRAERGFPPRKADQTSIGDAINWEWIVECAAKSSRDVIIVSRDSDFGLRLDGSAYINDWLEREFRTRVSPKRRVELSSSLGQALKRMTIPVSKAEEAEEQLFIAEQSAPQEILGIKGVWQDLLCRVRKASPFTGSYLLEATPVSLEDGRLKIGFEPKYHDHIELVNNTKNIDLLRRIATEMGLLCNQVSFVLLP